jgi:hypothetical protein
LLPQAAATRSIAGPATEIKALDRVRDAIARLLEDIVGWTR